MKHMLSLLITASLLAACGQADEDNTTNGNETEEAIMPIEVTLEAPEQIDVGVEATIDAIVTQDGEAVEDADEVMFEVWEEGSKDTSKMIEGEHQGDGVYRLMMAFNGEATYQVQSHVTARQMHNMPKTEIIVGNPSPDETVEQENEQESHADHETSDHDHGEASHHDHGLTMELENKDGFSSGTNQTISVQVANNEEALTDANVSLEIKHTTDSDDAWVDLTEKEAGQYSGSVTFSLKGDYTIVIHVEKEDLHDHQEKTITVE
ncbi:FixH family protein [Aquibacillus rhizosphaerae]|uniref:FixH family protein n=1 Tax=Aquibacillus rhizosphaerae TaxID=3051431 RepID=A0ABT7L1L5_9BACI|nr:FixH family protein [Aquibacillus sp. LR5S19]MDL4839269.1 FixH family protein [Aquibacillus sp. LR5S19]